MSLLSRPEAEEIVRKIRINNGGISEVARANSHQETLEALDSVRTQLGSSTRL